MAFGFTSGNGSDDDADGSQRPPGDGDPFGFLTGFGAGPAGFGSDPAAMGAALQKLGELMQWTGGPVNWDMARDVARQALQGGDRSVPLGQSAGVEDALRLAELWLDDVTTLPAAPVRAEAWSRAEWLDRTLPQWKALIDPVAERVVTTMTTMMAEQTGALGSEGLSALGLPGLAGPGMDATGPGGTPADAFTPLTSMMKALGGALFAAQVGQALGALAGEVVGSTDVGLPLAPDGRSALLPAGVAAFGNGLEIAPDEVRLYLALREAAHQRLFASAGWLRTRLQGDIEAYAAGLTVDTEALTSALGSIDPTDQEALQNALTGGLFDQEPTPAQQEVLLRLETLLALVEGWVDDVVDAAAAPRLAHAAALREAVRRRRASGGPAERLFADLVGLALRPRRLRDAASLWRALADAQGLQGRDAVWGHPDLLPGAEDLDDPAGFVRRSAGSTHEDDADRELRALLDDADGTDDADGADSAGGGRS